MKRKLLLFLLLIPAANVNAMTLSQYVTDLSKTDTVNMATDDADHNPRYIGANPNNYVLFNNELWRIIGVFDGKVKLRRYESIGNYSWDSSDKTINGGLGINNWAQADLMYELNGDYLNYNLTEKTKWYNGNNNLRKADFDYTKTIKKDAQELIVDTVWHTKTANIFNGELLQYGDGASASSLYYYERNSENIALNPGTSISNDNTQRYDTWTGKVGLSYPSDVLYAASGDDTISREACISNSQWRHDNYNCKKSDWMVTGAAVGNQWFLSTFTLDGDNRTVYCWLGAAQGNQAAWTEKTFPVVYLNQQVYITDGTGTESDPYQISLYHEIELIDGEESEIVKVEHDTKLQYKELSKNNYTFLGWYEDADFSKEYNFDTIVTTPKKLYAKWQSNIETTEETQEYVKGAEEVVTNNPKTGDNIFVYIALAIASVMGLITSRFVLKYRTR